MNPVTAQAVLKIVADVVRQPVSALTPQTDLYRDLKLDSLGALELLVELEDAYGVTIGTEDTKRLRTIEDIVELLLRLKPAGPSSR